MKLEKRDIPEHGVVEYILTHSDGTTGHTLAIKEFLQKPNTYRGMLAKGLLQLRKTLREDTLS